MFGNLLGLGGLGLYPTDDCYDPGRPSWLPYWLSSYTEEDCVIAHMFGQYKGVDYKTNLPVPPAPPPVGLPPANVVTGANVTPAEADAIQAKLAADEAAAWKAQTQAFMDKVAAGIDAKTKECSWYQVQGADGACTTGGWGLWAAVAAAGAAALYFVAGRR